jgi:hypothetical protein
METFKSHISESTVDRALLFHIENNIPLGLNVFRPHSENYYALFEHARKNAHSLNLTEFDKMLMESDIGLYGEYNGEAVPLDHPFLDESNDNVELNKPKRGGNKKYYVYVRNDAGNVVKVEFGDTSGLTAKINDPAARKSFAARHNCADKTDKTTPGYWSCRLPYYAKELGLKGGGNFYW